MGDQSILCRVTNRAAVVLQRVFGPILDPRGSPRIRVDPRVDPRGGEAEEAEEDPEENGKPGAGLPTES